MKNSNISLILNIILLVAVAYLFIDRFSGKKNAAQSPVTNQQSPADEPLNIVYINLDSLHAKSETFQAKKTELEKRQAGAEASLKAKGRSFEKELADYQKKVQSGNITPKEAQEIEQRLAQKEQSFRQEQERLASELMTETDKFNEEFTNQVRGYLDSLKTELNYDYILVFGTGSPVLVANDSLDITGTVLGLLNKKQ